MAFQLLYRFYSNYLIFLLLCCEFDAFADYIKPKHIERKVWNQLSPHFFPCDHELKSKLDNIFKKRVLLNIKTMKKAGFINTEPQKFTRLIVTKHPDLPNMIIKTYLDTQKAKGNKPEHYYWMKRIKGALKIKKFIQEKGWEDDFKVPKKWIYPLPEQPAPPASYQRINFILIEEDMNLLSNEENEASWGSEKVDGELLIKLHSIIDTLGLADCCKPDNIPFSIDGKISFIDTQTHKQWPISYKKLLPFLPDALRKQWKSLFK